MEDLYIECVPAPEKDVFRRYFQFYLYEHAAFTGKTPVQGVFEYPWLDAYWEEPVRRWPFWARVGDDVAALALVRLDEADKCHEMAEFFVVNRYQAKGLADRFAKDIIMRFKGPWKLNQATQNVRVTAFWRRVLGGIAHYTEAPLDRGDGVERIEQRFTV